MKKVYSAWKVKFQNPQFYYWWAAHGKWKRILNFHEVLDRWEQVSVFYVVLNLLAKAIRLVKEFVNFEIRFSWKHPVSSRMTYILYSKFLSEVHNRSIHGEGFFWYHRNLCDAMKKKGDRTLIWASIYEKMIKKHSIGYVVKMFFSLPPIFQKMFQKLSLALST